DQGPRCIVVLRGRHAGRTRDATRARCRARLALVARARVAAGAVAALAALGAGAVSGVLAGDADAGRAPRVRLARCQALVAVAGRIARFDRAVVGCDVGCKLSWVANQVDAERTSTLVLAVDLDRTRAVRVHEDVRTLSAGAARSDVAARRAMVAEL